MKQVASLLIDPALITQMLCNAMPVEKLQDLDGDLASVRQLITELRGDEGAVGSTARDRHGDTHHL
jgi:hypothetical protein